MSTGGDSNRTIIAALLANLGIAVAKFFGFLITRSSSMLAESIHSVADSGNQLLLILGGRRSRRTATELHQFGFGRERYFWSFVVSIVLFTLGGAFALYEGIEKILHPHEIESPAWAIGILGVSIVLEALSFRTARAEALPLKGRGSWLRYLRRAKSPEIPVVLLEDTGALLGLVFALVAIVIAVITGNGVWDGIGTTAIGTLLVVIAVFLSIEMKSLLIGEAASDDDQSAIANAISTTPGVNALLNLQTEHHGPESILVTAKVEFDLDLTIRDLARVIDDAEARVRAAVPQVGTIYLEPDVDRARGAEQKS